MAQRVPAEKTSKFRLDELWFSIRPLNSEKYWWFIYAFYCYYKCWFL